MAESLGASPDQAGLLDYIASELDDIRRLCQHNGRAFPLRLEALRLLALNGDQSRPEFDAETAATDSLCMTYATAAKRLEQFAASADCCWGHSDGPHRRLDSNR